MEPVYHFLPGVGVVVAVLVTRPLLRTVDLFSSLSSFFPSLGGWGCTLDQKDG